MHPKMAVVSRLDPGYMELNQEIGYTKVRWQLRKEKEEEEGEEEAGVSERKKQKLRQPSTEEEEKRKERTSWG